MNCLVVGASSRATAEKGRRFALERIKKCCSHSVRQINEAVFLGLGIVLAPTFAKATARQAVTGLFKPAPSPKPRPNPKILAPNGHNIF
jgi:hypothetical protein